MCCLVLKMYLGTLLGDTCMYMFRFVYGVVISVIRYMNAIWFSDFRLYELLDAMQFTMYLHIIRNSKSGNILSLIEFYTMSNDL